MLEVLVECDKEIVKAAETAIDNWKFGLKNRENGDVLAVKNIQALEQVVDNKRRLVKASESEFPRAATILTEHILCTIGNPRVLEGWINNKTAEEEIRKILKMFYELGKKEASVYKL